MPSVRRTPMGSCEPVRMTGLFRFLQDDESRIAVVVLADDAHQPLPSLGIHVRRVHRRIELIRVDTETEVVQLGDVLLELLHGEVFQRTRLGVFYHSDSTTGVY